MVQNDNFNNRTSLDGGLGQVIGTNIGATAEAGEPVISWPNNTVWYSWIAPYNGVATFDTRGSGSRYWTDTYLAAFTGNSVENLTELARNDDFYDVDSEVTLQVTAGTEYQIAVDGFGGSVGQFNLNYGFEASEDPPTDISLSNTSIKENVNPGKKVGRLSTTDFDQRRGFTYELVRGQGSADNSSFEIDAQGDLNILTSPDFETKSNYSIRVRTTDRDGLSYEKAFTIGIEDKIERISGTRQSERLKGDNGADRIAARGGNDRIYGYEGNDTILGGKGNDLIYGGDDDDYIDGGLGNDRIYGQAGADTIVIGEGRDSIYGFEVGTDKLQLKGFTFEELEITQRGSTSYVKVAETGDTLAKLTRVNAEALTAEGFVTPETMAA